MDQKFFTVRELNIVIQNDVMKFAELLIYHKYNNDSYYFDTLLPLYLDHKNNGRISQENINIVEKQILSKNQLNKYQQQERSIYQIPKNISLDSKTTSNNDSLTPIVNDIDNEKMTPLELDRFAKNNFNKFKKYAAIYFDKDNQYYNEVILPILMYRQKQNNINSENLEDSNSLINLAKKILLFVALFLCLLILIIGGVLYVNYITDEAERKHILSEEKIKSDYEKKNENLKRELDQKNREEYARQEEVKRKQDLEANKKGNIKFNPNSNDWQYIGRNPDGYTYFISGYNKTVVGANIWVKHICTNDCGVIDGTSIIALTSYWQYNFKKNTCTPSSGKVYLANGKEINQFPSGKESPVINGTIAETILNIIKDL